MTTTHEIFQKQDILANPKLGKPYLREEILFLFKYEMYNNILIVKTTYLDPKKTIFNFGNSVAANCSYSAK